MKKFDKNRRENGEKLMKSWTKIQKLIKMNGLERKRGTLIKQNKEAMGDKMNNIQEKVQKFRQNNKKLFRKIKQVVDNNI